MRGDPVAVLVFWPRAPLGDLDLRRTIPEDLLSIEGLSEFSAGSFPSGLIFLPVLGFSYPLKTYLVISILDEVFSP